MVFLALVFLLIVAAGAILYTFFNKKKGSQHGYWLQEVSKILDGNVSGQEKVEGSYKGRRVRYWIYKKDNVSPEVRDKVEMQPNKPLPNLKLFYLYNVPWLTKDAFIHNKYIQLRLSNPLLLTGGSQMGHPETSLEKTRITLIAKLERLAEICQKYENGEIEVKNPNIVDKSS